MAELRLQVLTDIKFIQILFIPGSCLHTLIKALSKTQAVELGISQRKWISPPFKQHDNAAEGEYGNGLQAAARFYNPGAVKCLLE